jgi:peroxiredoxin
VAVSVDGPEKSEALRVHLSLPFPILCDTERRVVRDWGIYNSREKGGIAKPAVFIIDPNHVVLYAAVDTVARRAPAAEIVSLLQNDAKAQPVRRRVHVPLLSDWIRAIRNSMQR